MQVAQSGEIESIWMAMDGHVVQYWVTSDQQTRQKAATLEGLLTVQFCSHVEKSVASTSVVGSTSAGLLVSTIVGLSVVAMMSGVVSASV